MKPHPRFGRLVRFANPEPELDAGERARMAEHVPACTRCGATVRWVRGARATLRAVDGPRAPADAWARIQARIEAGDVVLLPPAEAPELRTSSRSARNRWAAAAAALLLVAGAVSAAIPGSPLRQWLGISSTAPATRTPEPVPPPESAGPLTEAAHTTLMVAAAAGAVTVDIEVPDPALELRVRTAATPEVEVYATGDAAGARFRSGSGRLTVSAPGAGVIAIAVPRDARRVTLRVDGTPLVVKEGAELRVLAPSADTVGPEITIRLGARVEPQRRTP